MFRFNDELLISTEDKDLAKKLFPNVYFALDNAELRADFGEIDDQAKKAKSRTRLFGFWALGFAAVSLLTFPLEPIIEAIVGSNASTVLVFRVVAIIGACFGLAAILLGNIGLGFGASKRAWLQKRLACERLRQWQAQYIISHAPEIAEAANDEAKRAAFLSKRATDYASFKRSFIDQIESEYGRFTRQPSIGSIVRVLGQVSGAVSFWINPGWEKLSSRALSKDHSDATAELFDAYEKTRLNGQVQYTNYILSMEGSFWRLPRKQAQWLGQAAFSLVVFAFAANLIALLGASIPGFPVDASILGAFGIALAILAVAIRAVEEGLSPQREVHRMEQYAAVIDQTRVDFTSTKSLTKKRAAMRNLEQAATEEMIEFLSANENARFVL